MKRILSGIGFGLYTLVKWIAIMLLELFKLMLELAKVILLLFSIVARIFLVFVRVGKEQNTRQIRNMDFPSDVLTKR